MKYDYIYKMNCAEMSRNGQWPNTPTGLKQKNFREMVKLWAKYENLHGIDGIKHSATNNKYTTEFRYKLVAKVLAGNSQSKVALEAGINVGMLCNWIKRYKIYGYSGLYLKKGRPTEASMKKNTINTNVDGKRQIK